MTSRFPPLTEFNYNGTAGNDVVQGDPNAPNTFLNYGLGVDILTGGRLNDTFSFSLLDPWTDLINGAGGTDTVDYSDIFHGVMVNLAQGTTRAWSPGSVSAPTQFLSNIENVVGTQWNDFLVGNDLDNVLEGGGGGDVLNGGMGSDTASYANSSLGVIVALDGSQPASLLPSEAVGDILISIENVVGSDYGDTFYGNYADNTFDGRDGVDRVSYRGAGSSIQVDLREGIVEGGRTVGTDRLINIEQIEGTRFDDSYVASDRADTFVFGPHIGHDTIDSFEADADRDDHDLIRLEGVFENWDELEQHLTYDDHDDTWTITLDGHNSITLTNVNGTLNANDFYFG
jgi:Ca2+-binding RTX toxin-like protein